MADESTVAVAAERLAEFVTGRFFFVTDADGKVYASRVEQSGVFDYPVTSAAFRDVARRLWGAEHPGELFDDGAFERVRGRLRDVRHYRPPPALHRSASRALKALRVVTAAAREGKISPGDLHALGSELRAAIEAAADAGKT